MNSASWHAGKDGISDGEELAKETDPTIHDYEPPEVDVFRASFYKPSISLKTKYSLGYSVSDPAGVKSTAVVKDDKVRDSYEYDDYPEHLSVNSYFETSGTESIGDTVFGTTVRIRASDRHNNTHEQIGMERSNFYGTLADELGPMASEDTAADLGLLSGFTAGMGGTAETIGAVIDDPFGFLHALGQLASMMNQLGLLPKLLAAMPGQMVEDLKEKHDRNNPYDPDTEAEYHQSFKGGYYFGYGIYVLSSMLVGDSVMKSIKTSNQFQTLVDTLDRKGHVTQANRYLDAAKARTTEPVKRGGYKLGVRAAKGSWHLSKGSAQRILAGARTASGQVRLYHQVRKIDGHKLDDLTPSQEKRLRTMLARTGDDGVAAVNKMDKDTVEDLLSLRASCSRSGFSTQRYGGGKCVDEETLGRAVQSVVTASDDATPAVRWMSRMGETDRASALRLLADAEGDGVKIISYFERSNDLDSSDLTTLVDSTDTIDSVKRTDGTLTVETDAQDIGVEARYKTDGEQYLREEGGVGNKDLSDLSNQERGDIVEDEIAPKLMDERGYTKVDGFDKEASNEIGIDYIAKDPDTGDYVLIEAKFTSQFDDKNIGSGILDEGYGYKQMSDDWIEAAITQMRQEGIITPKLAKKLLEADDDKLRKSLVVVKNSGEDGRTITGNLGSDNLEFDHVDIIQIGEVVK